ncbi:MAG: hypothetical protein K5663_01105 [Clostridiales bacterium]|nr:hypothetical protein [Clostridiales bacterium]
MYYLPNPLKRPDGSVISDKSEWPEQRRYLLAMAQEYLYGTWPGERPDAKTVIELENASDGLCVQTGRLITPDGLDFSFTLRSPKGTEKPPVIIAIARELLPETEKVFINHGYALATFDFRAIIPDYKSDQNSGISYEESYKKAYKRLSCATIMAWGWGASLLRRNLEICRYNPRVIVTGHSRCGKAALCAGMFDENFAVAAPIGSGCGGAGCLRYLITCDGEEQNERRVETVGRINWVFPDWFTKRFHEYGGKPEVPPYTGAGCFFPLGDEINFLPFDSNTLMAAVAPRAVFTSEGDEDDWANPKGCLLAHAGAQNVFDMLGASGANAYNLRHGKHCFCADDAEALAEFCDSYFYHPEKLSNGIRSDNLRLI